MIDPSSGSLPGMKDQIAQANGQTIAYSIGGTGPAILLLHGFPQTRAMWHAVVSHLLPHFTVIAADLRGYGASSKPTGTAAYSFREMGADQHALMHVLGFQQYHLVGHDRGARTAHRMALDYADAVNSLTVMDIVPTHFLLNDLSRHVAKAYYHWFFLAQPAPFPETMILNDPDIFFERCLLGFGKATLDQFSPSVLDIYRTAWRNTASVSAMCNDYRAALEIDFELDAADLGRSVDCPACVLWGAQGAMADAYDVSQTWANSLSNIRMANSVSGGHFFPDQHPTETARALMAFLTAL